MTRVIMASKEEAILYGPEQKPWEETISSLARSMTGTLLVTLPSEDPSKAYQLIPGLDTHKYQVPSTGLSELQQQDAQKQTLAYLNECADNKKKMILQLSANPIFLQKFESTMPVIPLQMQVPNQTANGWNTMF